MRDKVIKNRVALLICFSLLALNACSKNDSTDLTPSPVALTPQEQIAKNFSVVRDDQTLLHNAALVDASGVTWSLASIVNTSAKMAESGCNEQGGTLPTSVQLDRLAKFLGRESPVGFHPEYAKLPIPGTSMASTWKFSGAFLFSNTYSEDGRSVFTMNGDTGEINKLSVSEETTGKDKIESAICVMPSRGKEIKCSWLEPDEKASHLFTGPISYSLISPDGIFRANFNISISDSEGASTLSLNLWNPDTNESAQASAQIFSKNDNAKSVDVELTTAKLGKHYRFSCSPKTEI